MSIVRARQPVITRILPHPQNKRIAVPNRFGMIPIDHLAKVTSFLITFGQDVSGTLVATGFSLLINGAPEAITSITQPISNELQANFAVQLIGDLAQLDYDGSGDFVGANGFKVGMFSLSEVIA